MATVLQVFTVTEMVFYVPNLPAIVCMVVVLFMTEPSNAWIGAAYILRGMENLLSFIAAATPLFVYMACSSRYRGLIRGMCSARKKKKDR